MRLTVSGRLDAGAVVDDLRTAGVGLPPDLEGLGVIPLEVDLALDGPTLRVEGRVVPGQAGAVALGRYLRIPNDARADDDLPPPRWGRGGVGLAFALEHDSATDLVKVERLALTAPGASATVSGRVDLAGDSADLRLEACVTDLARAHVLCPALAGQDLAGAGRLTARLAGPLDALDLTGTAYLDDVSAAPGIGTGDRVHARGSVALAGWSATASDLTLAWRDGTASLAGTADLTPGRRPAAIVRLTSRRLAFPTGGVRSSKFEDRRPDSELRTPNFELLRLARGVDVEATAAIDRLEIGVLALDNVMAMATLKDGRLRVDPAVALLADGGLAATATLDFADTAPAVTLDVRGVGIRAEGCVAAAAKTYAPMLRLTGSGDISGTLTLPLLPPASRPWPTGRVRIVWRGGRIQLENAPDWLGQLFSGLQIDRYPFQVMAADTVFEGGNRVSASAFFDSAGSVDIAARVRGTSTGTMNVEAGVDLLASVSPAPTLFVPDRPYVVPIYVVQEAWQDNQRVLYAGGFRGPAEVSYDLLIRRNALVQELGKAGGNLGGLGLRTLENIVPIKAIRELLGGRDKSPPAKGTAP